MSDWIRPIEQGWVVRDAVPGPDVDEFAEPDQVIAALAAPGAADTLLAVQHPARTPAALAHGLDQTAAVPIARAMLERLRKRYYRPMRRFVAPYRIEGPDGVASGLLCLVDPAAVTDDGTARVRHTEDVYPDVVAERAAVLAGLGCATSAALLVPATGGDLLTEQVERACAGLGLPDLSTSDAAGRRHELWAVPAGPLQDRLLAAVAGADLLVADGNHRVAAAAAAGHGALLALVTAGPQLRIGAINRVLTGTGFGPEELVSRWCAAGLDVRFDDHAVPVPGEVVVHAGSAVLRVPLPKQAWPDPVIDHEIVERVLFADALGVDPDGPHVHPLPAGRPAPHDADAVVLLAPVAYADVLAVHAAGRRMPRKATYFTPKPRSGLVLAAL
ncbi:MULTISPECIES: DUF1015 family protein [unclassified Amycolatopsis]|uniref:DUF1015 family protein n=1 Tax=unclassified Amycolatopsis TaxID=2618356 RepID=UPI002E123A31|nr:MULTISPECIES: DUF1015 family protein [unclassified Amycolatopsis]WSJ78969.1 DUF1015 family protein [Amycolatopsis sp. NBC_01307]WSK77542.1 DUF1015 family protein [Amycolatopsis sp. NBC_01286]